ncbi:MAG TPA: hypothetical protein VNY05_23210 [Candidatus Acidoferrales bacterium]|jgi:hypothetical protein|nr:hypothetical protein [Candidatus Acidoferrales bacterium]
MQDIRDALQPEMLPAAEFPWPVLLLIIPLVWLALILYRRRQRAAPVATPEAVARGRLHALAAITEPRAFYAELAAILNQYLEARLHLGAARLTSVEIAHALARVGVMSTGWQESLEALLGECDRAKFSGDEFSGNGADWDRAAAMARARNIVDLLAANVASTPSLANPWERLGQAEN